MVLFGAHYIETDQFCVCSMNTTYRHANVLSTPITGYVLRKILATPSEHISPTPLSQQQYIFIPTCRVIRTHTHFFEGKLRQDD